ncbi:TM1802 family CRISPR-associated protein [Halothermothrix orenii]|uniref:Putative glutamate--cysteine ligase/putative amino acid ligase/CRISPR-associated protein, TM1802 family n=1 Tax=Halothermothrix orenii (strain H 168 / OCM 544 / DSM 9562) TaxID=373903 RepID=B8CYA5_HALOH|nr:TM1802 family CRISPR-associated protein [Halothermothrix orenii]ACL70274.1 putative glutamate--cysteine ligase/putative amino acid ligase/CRISPR-associated protein, TM1802 family [Halothermothrix orenii H 168]
MINSFKELGEIELQGLSDSEKKQKFLETQTIIPNEPDSGDKDADKYREVIINLDTEKEEIEIKLGKELYEKNREEFFGFDLKASNSSKTYFTTDNYNYHLLTIPHLIYYIEKEIDKLKIKNIEDFLDWLNMIKNKFYIVVGRDYFGRPISYLSVDKNVSHQKKEIVKYLRSEIDKYEKRGNAEKAKEINKYINGEVVNTEILTIKDIKKYYEKQISLAISTTQNFLKNELNIFSIHINGKRILESIYKAPYVEVVYYILQQRFFDTSNSDKMARDNALCGVCNENKLITGKIDIPTKFYVTSSPYFYENLERKNAYKSFGICQDCYLKVMAGIAKVKKDFSGKLFNQLDYYVIPTNIAYCKKYKTEIEVIKSILSDNNKSFKKNIEAINSIANSNLKVNFLFWFKPKGQNAAFVVSESINDVAYNHISQIIKNLYNLNMKLIYPNKYFNLYKLTFNDIYWLLFPNTESHKNPDPKLYRKELLSLLNSILKGRSVNYNYLIKQFNFILRKRYFKNSKRVEEIIYNPMKMNLLLTWLNEITEIKGGFKMSEGTSSIPIENSDIKEFFSTHAETYKNNKYRQGLFLLGVLMNEVLKKQQKENKSASILDKLSFDGMSVRQVSKFVNDITEILHIHDKYTCNQLLHSQMIDRIQGIENSSLNKDEVVFYILSGISFGRYLGHKYYKTKNNKGDDK